MEVGCLVENVKNEYVVHTEDIRAQGTVEIDISL